MTRKGNVKTRSSEREVTPLPLSDCYLYDGTSYFWDCGNDRKWHKYYVPTKIMECVDDGSGFKGFPFMEEELYLVERERIITRLLAQLKFWIKKKNW